GLAFQELEVDLDAVLRLLRHRNVDRRLRAGPIAVRRELRGERGLMIRNALLGRNVADERLRAAVPLRVAPETGLDEEVAERGVCGEWTIARRLLARIDHVVAPLDAARIRVDVERLSCGVAGLVRDLRPLALVEIIARSVATARPDGRELERRAAG